MPRRVVSGQVKCQFLPSADRAGPGIQCKFLTFGPKCQRLPPPDSWNRKTFLEPRLGIILRLNVTRKLGQQSWKAVDRYNMNVRQF